MSIAWWWRRRWCAQPLLLLMFVYFFQLSVWYLHIPHMLLVLNAHCYCMRAHGSIIIIAARCESMAVELGGGWPILHNGHFPSFFVVYEWRLQGNWEIIPSTIFTFIEIIINGVCRVCRIACIGCNEELSHARHARRCWTRRGNVTNRIKEIIRFCHSLLLSRRSTHQDIVLTHLAWAEAKRYPR